MANTGDADVSGNVTKKSRCIIQSTQYAVRSTVHTCEGSGVLMAAPPPAVCGRGVAFHFAPENKPLNIPLPGGSPLYMATHVVAFGLWAFYRKMVKFRSKGLVWFGLVGARSLALSTRLRREWAVGQWHGTQQRP